MSDLQPGDVVTLKSGGPNMTIESVNAYAEGTVTVSWFDGPEYKKQRIAVVALKKVDPKTGPAVMFVG